MAHYQPLALFVQYPNREPVLREMQPPQSLGELREKLEVFDDQQLLIAEKGVARFSPLDRPDQLHDGIGLRITVPHRRIFVNLHGSPMVHHRPVVWYPGACAEQIEGAIAKACGLPAGTPIELVEGDVAVVISATIPNDSILTAVPLPSVSPPPPPQPQPSHASPGACRHNTSVRRVGNTSGSANLGKGAPESPRRQAGFGAASSASSAGQRARSTGGSLGPHGRSANALPGNSPGGGCHSRVRSATPSHGGSSAVIPPARDRTAANRAASPARPITTAAPPPPAQSSYVPAQINEAMGSPGGCSGESPPGGCMPPHAMPQDLPQTAAQPSRASQPDEHCVHILAGHSGFVLSLCSVGDVLFTGSQDCSIMIWDLNNLQYIGTLPGHRGFVKCMVASLSKKMLCSGSQDKTIRIWSLETFSSTRTLTGHTSEVNAVTILEGIAGGDVILSAGEDRTIKVWNLASASLLASLDQAHQAGIFALSVLDPGTCLSASRDRTIKVWNASNWQARKTLSPPHYDAVTGMAVAPKSGRFYSTSRDRSIRRWDARTLESDLQMPHAHGDWLTALAVAPSEQLLYSGGKDGVVKVWSADLQCKDQLSGHRGSVSALCAVDKLIFSASHDRTVRVWKLDHLEGSA